jgi:hypothetical protein
MPERHNAVFSTGGFESIFNTESYRILSMGQSPGAADSVITAVALI